MPGQHSAGNHGMAFGFAVALADGPGTGNVVIAGTDSTATVLNGNNNFVVAHQGSNAKVANGNRNSILATGSSGVDVVGTDSNVLAVAACGGSVTSAQAARISAPCAGL